MAKSLQPEGMRDELTCSVCLELFKTPMTLPCEHSLCEECLNKIQKKIEPSSISVDCPLCRRTFQLQNIKKNHVLIRIVEVYKEDAIRRSQSCSDLSSPTMSSAPKGPSSKVTPLQQTPEFCRPFDNSEANHAPATLRKSVLELRETFKNCELSEDEADCLTQCTATCTDPPGRAVVLCTTCSNQFCRVCWGREHDLNGKKDHDINVYIKAFREPDGKDILCSVCDYPSLEKAKYICFHCNMNFCQSCYKLVHPEIEIHHYIVKRPDVIPEQRYCSCCTRKIATSICSICKDFYFCKRCLLKATNHSCFNNLRSSNQLNGTASLDRQPISETKIKKELFNMMQLRKQIVKEIPKFALKKATRCKPDLRDGDRVVYQEDENNYKCTVRWIGESLDGVSTIVGVEFDDPVGTGNGAYNGERKFNSLDGHACFIDPKYLIRVSDYNPQASVDALCEEGVTRNGVWNGLEEDGDQDNDLETDGVEFGPNPDALDEDLQIFSDMFSNNLNSSSLEDLALAPVEVNVNNNLGAQTHNQRPVPKPRKKSGAKNDKTNSSLKIGENVAFFHEDSGTLCKAVVKWIGVLPDTRKDKITVGVEFDKAIGSGTGKFQDHRLFFAKMNHASLIPIEGLLRYEDVCVGLDDGFGC